MKKMVWGFVFGVVLTNAITILAASTIKSAMYNSVEVIYNDSYIELEKPLVSIVDSSNSNYFSNYMPIRGVLEGLGYAVFWEEDTQTVRIRDPYEIAVEKYKEYLENDLLIANKSYYQKNDFTLFKASRTGVPMASSNESLEVYSINGDKKVLGYAAFKDRLIYIDQSEENLYYELLDGTLCALNLKTSTEKTVEKFPNNLKLVSDLDFIEYENKISN